jgi:hypothetical protein
MYHEERRSASMRRMVIASVALIGLAGCGGGTGVACLGQQKIYENQTGGDVKVWAILRNNCAAPYRIGGSGLDLTVPPGGDRTISISVPDKSSIFVEGPPTHGSFEYEIKEMTK